MFSLKKKLTLKKRRASSSSNSVSDAEDRVVMVCEEIPSEISVDSGRGSHSAGTRSSQGSSTGDADNGHGWSSGSIFPKLSLNMEEGSNGSVSVPSPGDHYAVRSTLRVKELYWSELSISPLFLYSFRLNVISFFSIHECKRMCCVCG